MSILPDILNVISAARLWKNLPLLFIFLSGVVLCGGVGNIPLPLVITGIIGIAFSSAFMTHLNIITDRELDLIEKPHLYRMLSSNKMVMKSSLIIELFITFLAITLFIGMGYIVSGLMILLFTIVAILYSYNFFSSEPQRKRLKVHWIGHFIILLIGYISLWSAGFFICGNLSDFLNWLPIFVSISLSEYSLFLFESSVDQRAEKEKRLKTLTAILGQQKTTIIAIVMALVSFILLIIMFFLGINAQIIMFSFLPVSILILFFLITVSYKRLYLYSETFKIPDLIFNFGRIYILLSLTYFKAIL